MLHRDMSQRRSLRLLMLVLLFTPLVAMGGGGASMAQDGATPESSPAQPTFDLSGVQITITGSQPEALGMTTDYSLEMLQGWGAEIENVELTSTTSVQALLAGRTDIGSGGADELILGAAEGADITAIASTRAQMDYVLVARSGIDSPADLEGATIGMSGPAGFDALLARVVIREAGLTDADVNFVQIGGSGDRSAALLAGRIDAAVVFISDGLELERSTDEVHPVLYLADVVTGFSKSLLFANSSYWEENPEIATAVACATLEANQWFHEDREGWIAYTLENVPGSTEEATSELYDLLVEINMYPTTPQ